jgi:hypothetical protein
MGILDGLFGGGMTDPVTGTAQVVSATGYHGRGIYQACTMQIVVQAEGVPATSLEVHELVHNKRWPRPGMVVPCMVDRADPGRVKLDWDQVPSSSDTARATAEAIAAQMRAHSTPPPAPAPAPDPDAALADRLAKLAELHASGALTDAEFAAAKAKLLD